MAETDLAPERLHQMYRDMLLIRRFEERAAELRMEGLIPGFLHPYIGQEAVAVGVCAALGPRAALTSTHRGHGHILARGASPARMYAELYARRDGYNRAKGGSLHMIDTELGFLGANGIVGGGIPLATGAGLQLKRTGVRDVAVSFFGDGATNEGAFHESLNLASLWKLPVIYIVENNKYAMGTALERASALTELWKKAEGFAMPGVLLDGMDVARTFVAVEAAIAQARAEMRPTFIEARCYRFRGHSMSDPAKYRTQQEVEDFKQADPIQLCRASLLHKGWATEAELEAWDEAALEEAADAASFAKDSPQPRLEDVGLYVYADDMGWRPDEATFPHRRD